MSSLILMNEGAKGEVSSSSHGSHSAFHSVPSASSEGAQPPPTHPNVKTTPPGAHSANPRHRSHSSSGSDSSTSPPPPMKNEADDDDEGEEGDDDEDRREGGDKSQIGRLGGEKAFDWPSHSTYDERRGLLGTEEESSERPSSDEDEDKNPWTITREQLNYYTTQFFSMQPNPRGAIPGALAKEFFEKSRLPINELRKIWQLSDVNKDGSLSLEEFLTAMHLVVLRRNDIDLPETLPTCLQPISLRNRIVDRHNKDLYHDENDPMLLSSQDEPDHSLNQSSKPRQVSNTSDVTLSPNSVASPGPKPVNFDFHDARMNPRIIQPVAVRLSPDSPVIPTSEDDENAAAPVNMKQNRREVIYEQLWNQEDASASASAAEESLSSMTLKGDLSSSAGATISSRTLQQRLANNSTDEEDLGGCSTEMIDGLQDLSPSPPSLPKDPSTTRSSNNHQSLPYFSNALAKQKRLAGLSNNDLNPPPPPPRPGKTAHARSSSLDLNNLRNPPPALPPRTTTSTMTTGILEKSTSNALSSSNSTTRDAKAIQMSIHQIKERNSVIARTINELHQEVSDTLEERIALEFHLENLKSFGD